MTTLNVRLRAKANGGRADKSQNVGKDLSTQLCDDCLNDRRKLGNKRPRYCGKPAAAMVELREKRQDERWQKANAATSADQVQLSDAPKPKKKKK